MSRASRANEVRQGAGRSEIAARSDGGTGWRVGLLLLTLGAIFWLRHGETLWAPFFSDDFVLLDKVRGASFAELFAPRNLQYGWYRPWSRELHYWVLERLFGLERLPFHLVLVALWLGVLTAYVLLIRRLAGWQTAVLAACGAATLAAWGVPLEWGAGAQELWALLFSLSALLAFAAQRPVVSTVALCLGLLSKESAAVVPAIALVLAITVEHLRVREALARVAPLIALTAVWGLFHPALGGRLWWSHALPSLPQVHTPPLESAASSLLGLINLDLFPRPASGWQAALLRATPGALLLASVAGALGFSRPVARTNPSGGQSMALVALGSCWTVLGWTPLLMRSVVWQPYYILMGALGAWLAGATLLAGRRWWLSSALVMSLGLLAGVRAETRAKNWGNEQLQRDGKLFVSQTEAFLKREHPTLPRRTRMYFTSVPVRTVFILGHGDTPALRVWYRDPTMRGYLWSDYVPRTATDSVGPDLFFRLDPSTGWIEVADGKEDLSNSRPANPRWEADHVRLALTFSEAGDLHAAAQEFEKLARADSRNPTYPYMAGLCHEGMGDSLEARRWYGRAAKLPGASEESISKARDF